MFSIIPEDTLADLKIMFGDAVEALGKDELTALAVCHIEGDITNNRLQYIVDRHKTDITKLLQDLCKNGFLVSESKNRWTTYRLDITNNNEVTVNKPGICTTKANNSKEDPLKMDRFILDGDVTSVDSSSMDSSSMDSSNVDSYSMASSNMDTINVDSTNRRYNYEELSNRIIAFCTLEYKSSAEIANAVSKSEKYLKNNIISKMIAEERLIKLHSDNHPSQKYMAKNGSNN